MSLVKILRALEERLHDNAVRKNIAEVSAMLAENFKEFGASGRVYSKQEVLALLAAEENYSCPIIEAFNVELQTPDVAIVTYRSVRAMSYSLRSSVWIRDREDWQMLFHQGTTGNNPARSSSSI